jgi:RNA polymerase sigma factor (sigma-70 family)
MASAPVHPVIRFIRGLTARPSGDPGDGALLARFVGERDEAAFAALLQRHGPMVHGVCRRVLGDGPDADDAFQATFLVLVRKAGSIGRPGLLGNWLYGVASRTALKARAVVARRRAELRPLPEVAVSDPVEDVLWRDLRPVLDEELSRLPDRYRTAVVLCDLEGRTHEEAARSLGCPRETVTTRLTRARARLRSRLVRRGLTLSAGLLATVLAGKAAPAAPPAGLVDFTTRAALHFAAGQAAAGAIPPQVAALTGGVLRAMFWSQLRRVVVGLAAVACCAAGAVALTYRMTAAEPPGQKKEAPPAQAPGKPADPAADDRAKLQGTWVAVSGEREGVRFDGEKDRGGSTITIKGDQVIFEPSREKGPITFELDPTRDPKLMTMTAQEGPDKGRGIPWIYEVEGDRLKLCWDTKDGKKVPKEFASPPGSGLMLLVLKRETDGGKADRGKGPALRPPVPAPEKEPEQARQDREAMQGTWELVEAETKNGRATADQIRGFKVVVKGDRITFNPDGENRSSTFKLDPSKSPKAIDLIPTDGPAQGQTVPGIYELKGDTLKLCADNEEGRDRPTDFAVRPGTGFRVLALKRQPAERARPPRP